MLLGFRNLLFRGNVNQNITVRNISSSNVLGMVRVKPPIIHDTFLTYRDRASKNIILYGQDRFANHTVVCERNYPGCPPMYFRAIGTLTSSAKPIMFHGEKLTPEMIDSHLMNGKNTPQYLIKYPGVVFILKKHVVLDDTFFIEDKPWIKDYLEQLH